MEGHFLNSIEEHQGIIYKVCRMYRDTKEDQEDLFQEIVLQLWKAYPKFKNESKLSTWMYRIALNTAIAIFRKNTVKLDFKDALKEYPKTQIKEQTSENEERMFEAIRTLKPAERAIIALFLEGYSHREIGEIIGATENYIGVRMNRIKNKLKKILN